MISRGARIGLAGIFAVSLLATAGCGNSIYAENATKVNPSGCEIELNDEKTHIILDCPGNHKVTVVNETGFKPDVAYDIFSTSNNTSSSVITSIFTPAYGSEAGNTRVIHNMKPGGCFTSVNQDGKIVQDVCEDTKDQTLTVVPN